MSGLKPGGLNITKKAMEVWNLPKGSKVLDIGCGNGETLEFLQDNYGFVGKGIDLSLKMINESKERNPKLDISYGDGEFLDEFPSLHFDGVLMECVLSLVNIPEEALHEIYCVLKRGGKLFISDLYIKNPDKGLIKSLAIEAERQKSKPHEAESCSDCKDDHKDRVCEFRSCGRFLLDPLMKELRDIGFTNIKLEDCSIELDNYVAEKIMKDGTLDLCFCKEAVNPKDKQKTGYFIITAEKPQ